jgi:OPA family glycerol-3-phosphate transporter-like MFS transporter
MTEPTILTHAGARLKRWQWLTVGLMVVGYAGYYLCRSNLSATMPLITEDLVSRGMDPGDVKEWLGWAVSLGTIGYALGKFAAGSLTDLLGGRRNYLIGMAGAVACTVLLPLGGSLPVFTLIWFLNRLIQSLGWPGMIKITSRWVSYSAYGTVMGVISLSFLFGDAAARAFMGQLIEAGLGWRVVFWIAGGVLAFLLVLNVILIRESPQELGLPEPCTNPENLFGALGEDPHPDAAGPLLLTLARSPAFWIVCLLSLGLTLLRETFNNWTPTYLVEGVGLPKGVAAGTSAVFPFFGGISVMMAGFLGDRFGRVGRATIILGGIALCGLVLAVLGATDFAGRSSEALVLVAAVAFLLIGPYSYLAGAISLDFGGKRGHTLGWQGVFKMLAVVALLTGIVAACFLVNQMRPAGTAVATPLEVGCAALGIEREEGERVR